MNLYNNSALAHDNIKNRTLPDFRDLLKKLPQIILLYFFIFQPEFISRTSYFLLEFLIFTLFVLFKPSLFFFTFKKFKTESYLFLSIILYTILRDLFRGEEVYFLKIFLWAFQAFFFSIVIVAHFNNNKKNNNSYPDLLSLSYWVAILAAFASFFLLINFTFNHFYNSLIIQDPGNQEIGTRIYRGYGIGENLTFTYSYLLGIFTGYTLYILNYRAWYIVFVPFLILGVIFNARIGILPISIFLLLLFKRKYSKNLLIITSLIVIIVLALPEFEIYQNLEQNKDWLTSFFLDFGSLFSSNELDSQSSTLGDLLTNFIVFPDTISDWIFGSGINLFLFNPGKPYSDIGYITQLNYGGLLFILSLFSLFFYMVRRLKLRYGFKNWFFLVFTFSILILNFKGSAFVSTPGSRFLYMIYIYMIVLSSTNKNKDLAEG